MEAEVEKARRAASSASLVGVPPDEEALSKVQLQELSESEGLDAYDHGQQAPVLTESPLCHEHHETT